MIQEGQHNRSQKKENWTGWYAFVILFLVLQIVLFTLFTRYFS